jgi:hypothetical protein
MISTPFEKGHYVKHYEADVQEHSQNSDTSRNVAESLGKSTVGNNVEADGGRAYQA